jgi:photosystem II stability/assembly factor-like uncharacterized protein
MKLLLAVAALAACSILRAASWQSAGPWGGTATAITINPSSPTTLLAGARNSLVFRSTDSGLNWRRLPFPRHFLGEISTLWIDPANPSRYLAGVHLEGSPFAGLWISGDAGRTWRQSETLNGFSVQALDAWQRNPARLVAGTRQGVWRSIDGGNTWDRISRPWNHEMRAITAVAIDPADPDVIYAGTTHLPWKTTDGGKSWVSIHDGMLDDSDVFSIFIDPARPQNIFASACSGIYRSENAGAKWTRYTGIPSTLRRTHAIRQLPSSPGVVLAGTTLGLLRSNGNGFRQLNNLHILSMVFQPGEAETLFLATANGGIWRSTDAGATVEPRNLGFVSRRVSEIAASGDTLYLNTLNDAEFGGIFVSRDGGTSFDLRASSIALGGQHMQFLAASPSNSALLLAGGIQRLRRSTDAGKTWKDVPLPGKSARLQSLTAIEDHGTVWLAGTDHGLFRSKDAGATWTPIAITKARIRLSVTGFHLAHESRRVLARTDQTLYLSEDAGATWTPIGLLFPVAQVYDAAIPASTPLPFLLATSRGLLRSADGGSKWEAVTGGLEDGTVTAVAWQPGPKPQAFAVQFGRLYSSSDLGSTWSRVPGADLDGINLRRLYFAPQRPNRVLGLAADLGVFTLDLASPAASPATTASLLSPPVSPALPPSPRHPAGPMSGAACQHDATGDASDRPVHPLTPGPSKHRRLKPPAQRPVRSSGLPADHIEAAAASRGRTALPAAEIRQRRPLLRSHEGRECDNLVSGSET